MQQRTKLLVGSLASSLGIIALFAGISFTSALDLARHRIPSLLHEHNQRLIETLPKQPSLEQIQATLPHHGTRSDSLSIIDTQGRLLGITDKHPGTPSPPVYIDSGSLLAASSGYTTIDDNEYIWVTTPIPDSPYTIVNTHHNARVGLREFMKHIGVPIGFAALISIWLSTWGAMVISSLFRRLNEQRAQLEHQAHHDPLTGLPNRDALSHTIDATIAHLDGGKQTLAVCMIDLHQFKEINDSLGHHCGDELLRQVAIRLSRALQTPDQAGRFYGNKFAIMLTNIGTATIDVIAGTLLGTLENAFEIDGRCLYIRGTLGIALYPEHAVTAPALLQKAEAAIFQARDNTQYAAIFRTLDNKGAAERLGLINDLRNALRDGQLELHYQPKLDLRSRHIIGAEALARWTHPQHGAIPPDQFIEIAERTGLIKELTRWVLETAVQQCAQCHASGKAMKISANLSAINLHDDELVPLIASLLKQHKLPAQNLVVEITETAMMADPARAKEQLRKLDVLGVSISIDDFGTGYSSLGHLRQLPVDEIKIDKSFVMDMIASEDDASIVRATIGLAHDLGLEVVAEGVEDEAILKQLSNMGCDIAQGYHIARPMPVADFIAMLEKNDKPAEGKSAAASR
ncbi:diguanylate cyclase/phosphodiesterase (GGDEF & EAL domains) with PAS/PAC sensor(s) [hydrothermal vent metagenome]|uniref:Diguanylate cyclase/phosphodiesterase (GGDEF & EAL domains) with PAS/PAC sensor(S) n=1 Tax=hydrothermal vent metagenome TaxID=652676 RepID=A0A3B1BBA7_9ZZZZ